MARRAAVLGGSFMSQTSKSAWHCIWDSEVDESCAALEMCTTCGMLATALFSCAGSMANTCFAPHWTRWDVQLPGAAPTSIAVNPVSLRPGLDLLWWTLARCVVVCTCNFQGALSSGTCLPTEPPTVPFGILLGLGPTFPAASPRLPFPAEGERPGSLLCVKALAWHLGGPSNLSWILGYLIRGRSTLV
eukprot:scaffold1401_cov330-Pavlova_lutheri.AAC.12